MLVNIIMKYLKKNVKIKSGYSYTAIYDFNNRETYLISKHNGELLLSNNVNMVDNNLNGALSKIDIIETDERISEKELEQFDYELFDDYMKYKYCDTIYFEVTNKCNFNCIHCYADMGKNGTSFLNVDDLALYIKNLDVSERMNFRFTGGEPFLNPHINELLQYTATNVVPFQRHSIVTNGSGKYEDILYALKLGFEVQISIYGMCEKTFEKVARVDRSYYNKVFSLLKKLANSTYSQQIVCLFSINSLTFDEMRLFVETIKEMGFRVILNRPSSVGRANDNWDLLRLNPVQHMEFSRYNYSVANGYNRYCFHACKLSWAYIDINGNVRPCAFIRDAITFGNLKTTNMSEMRSNKKFKDFKNMNANSFEKCNKCELEFCCTGGCCGETLVHTGSILNSYVWCVVKPYDNKEYTYIDNHTIKKVRKYAGGTFDFIDISNERR